MGFKKWIPPADRGKRNHSVLGDLQPGQSMVMEGIRAPKARTRIRYHYKLGREYEYMECVNGVVIRRIK